MATPVLPERTGHIIAFEGPSELVSTQLRLLPASPQIRVLPSLPHYMRDSNPELPFDARQLIHRIHTAAQARHAEALEFLRTPMAVADGKRLVFMDGGTIGAHAACLSAIMEHQTGGNAEAADLTFSQLVSDGVAGLLLGRPSSRQSGEPSMADKEDPELVGHDRVQEGEQAAWERLNDDGPIEDPIMQAMRAADKLYKQTEFLQPASHDVDLTARLIDIPPRSRRRSSAPAIKTTEASRSSTSSVYSQDREPLAAAAPSVSINRGVTDAKPASATARKPPLRISIPSPPVPWAGDVSVSANRQLPSGPYHPHHLQLLEPLHPKRPRTAEAVLSSGKEQARTGSIVRKYQGSNSGSKYDSCSMPNLRSPSKPEPGLGEGKDDSRAANRLVPKSTETRGQPFTEVLPLLEDFVIQFSTETSDEVLDLVFERFKDGYHPGRVLASGSSAPEDHDTFQQIATGPQHLVAGDAPRDEESISTDGDASSGETPRMEHGLPTPGHSPTLSDTTSAAALNLDRTFYSLSITDETAVSIQNCLRSLFASHYPLQAHGYSALDSSDHPEATGLWKPLECNAGRTATSGGNRRVDMILAVGAESGVQKDRVSVLAGQIEKLGTRDNGLSRSGRLDIRCVARALLYLIALANSETRYLVVNAMQAFTRQPLAKQTHNPFSDPTLLAALVIPHLDTYLSTNPEVRFLLIEYPAEHLPTILALQNLIGTEMMKIVGIVKGGCPSQSTLSCKTDTADSSTKPSVPPQACFRALSPPGAILSSSSISKANFLLASTATAFETAAFVAAIRESLISISDFYIPERPLYKHPCPKRQPSAQRPAPQPRCQVRKSNKTKPIPNPKPKAKPAPSSPPRQQDSPSIVTTITPPSSPDEPFLNRGLRPPFRPPPRTKPHLSSSSSPPAANSNSKKKAASSPRTNRHRGIDDTCFGPTVDFTSTPARGHNRGHHHHRCPRHHHRNQEPVADDDDEDEEERRLMPMYLSRQAGKGDGKKALKWLGLV
ncbi:hypothetical protein MMYC01_200779 [Madurella mycetomatis]|uniref:Gastric mucin-like protein n=1 Tax=Madurella mycetomatis TaxID=100816 RepID=A0A175WG88_9PEZI|nr:hypothetical protein MMYC01_200779 [Madurella mycetomatis]